MPSASNLHSKFGYSRLSPSLHPKAGFALSFVVFGTIAAASGAVFQMADRTPMTDDRSSIAAIPTSDRPAASIDSLAFPAKTELPRDPNTIPAPTGATLAVSTVSPEPIADGAPASPQDSAFQSDSAESTPPSVPGATLSRSIVSPEPNADGALDSRQDSAAEPASVKAAPDLTATKPSRPTIASKKSRKSVQSQSRRRDRGYIAEERAWFNHASRVY